MSSFALFHPAFSTPGGAEWLCLSQALALSRMGESTTVVTMEFDRAHWSEVLEDIPVREVIRRSSWSDSLRGFTRLAKLRICDRAVGRQLDGFEVVVAHNPPCHTILGASDLDCRKVWQCNEPPRNIHVRAANPVLTSRVEAGAVDQDCFSARSWMATLRDFDRDLARKRSLFARTRYEIEQVQKLDHVYAISEFSRDNARKIYGRCGGEVVYPIVRFAGSGRLRAGIDRSGLHVLAHSRLDVPKNIDTVIRGFATFARAHPGSHLHIVGEGPIRAALTALAEELIEPNGFTFHGFLPTQKLRSVYERCDVFALLPLDEPFGMVFPEAAARGLLLIGPDHGGPMEILDGGRLGWCVDPFRASALAEALEKVWALSDAEADRHRSEADLMCRARFSEGAILPILRKAILEGRD
jgi:glycosyltransferase involved in cell wall biosynthesis